MMTDKVKLAEYTASRFDDLIESFGVETEEEWDQLLSQHSESFEAQIEAEFEEMEMDA